MDRLEKYFKWKEKKLVQNLLHFWPARGWVKSWVNTVYLQMKLSSLLPVMIRRICRMPLCSIDVYLSPHSVTLKSTLSFSSLSIFDGPIRLSPHSLTFFSFLHSILYSKSPHSPCSMYVYLSPHSFPPLSFHNSCVHWTYISFFTLLVSLSVFKWRLSISSLFQLRTHSRNHSQSLSLLTIWV